VRPNPVKEIGWGEVRVSANEVARDWFGDLQAFESFQWHGETFSIPPGATRVMQNAHCLNQGYALGKHFGIMEERAAAFGTEVNRDQWRLVCPMHIAETLEQAREDVRYGLGAWVEYFGKTAAFPHFGSGGASMDMMIEYMNDSGMGIIGTVDQARELIGRLQEQTGGFGSMLTMATDWANPAATRRSFELIANEVAPHFQGQSQPLYDAAARAGQTHERHSKAQLDAIEHMAKKYEAEVAATS